MRATRGIADNPHTPRQQPVSNDTGFTIVFASIFTFYGYAGKNVSGVGKIQAAFG